MNARTPQFLCRNEGERGMVTVEAALLIVLFLVPMLLLVMDAGRFITARHSLTQAVRQGAVVLIHAQASSQADTQASTAVKEALEVSGYRPGEVTVVISRPNQMTATITVTLDTTRFAVFGVAFTVLPVIIRESATVSTG